MDTHKNTHSHGLAFHVKLIRDFRVYGKISTASVVKSTFPMQIFESYLTVFVEIRRLCDVINTHMQKYLIKIDVRTVIRLFFSTCSSYNYHFICQ